MSTISERCWNQDQSWNYEHIWSHETQPIPGGDPVDHAMKTEIRRNAYDFQSYLKVSRWDGTKWQTVTCWPMTMDRLVFGISYVSKGITAAHFSDDAAAIEHEAATIIQVGS